MRSPIAVLLLAAAPLVASFDPSGQILARWSDPARLGLLAEAGVTVVIAENPTDDFAGNAVAAGMVPFAELPAAPSMEPLRNGARRARAAGFRGLAVEASGALAEEKTLHALIAEQKGLDLLVYLRPPQIGWKIAPAHAVLRHGLWPGVRSGPNVNGRGIEVATASREPWVDANSYLIAYLRGMFPERPAVLGYRPDLEAGLSGGRSVPYETLELALVEAFAAGGNYVLALPDDYRAALFKGDAKAAAAWRSLGETVRFLRDHRDQFRQPQGTRLAVAAGTLAESGELLNLMFRRNLCPVIVPAAAMPKLDPIQFRGLVAANISPPRGANLDRMLEFGRAGGLLIAAGREPWWAAQDAHKTRNETDRDFYSLGKGQVVAYRQPIADPSEFALDVIDALGVRTRDIRLWNASTVTALAGSALLMLVNYGDPRDEEFPARIEGNFQKALLLEPGSATPRSLPVVKRGSSTEITVDHLRRFALIRLE